MSRFFQPNIKRHGRIARGAIGGACLVTGIIIAGDYTLWGLIPVIAGLFAIGEALSGWCLIRACGIRTKL